MNQTVSALEHYSYLDQNEKLSYFLKTCNICFIALFMDLSKIQFVSAFRYMPLFMQTLAVLNLSAVLSVL